MPLTVFDIKGIPTHRREHIEAAVIAGGKHARAPHEAWIAVDRHGVVKVLMTGPGGFERYVGFGADEQAGVIAELVRNSLED